MNYIANITKNRQHFIRKKLLIKLFASPNFIIERLILVFMCCYYFYNSHLKRVIMDIGVVISVHSFQIGHTSTRAKQQLQQNYRAKKGAEIRNRFMASFECVAR